MAHKERNKETKPIEKEIKDDIEIKNSLSLEEGNHEKIQILENEVEELKDNVLRKAAE